MAFVQYLTINGHALPLPSTYNITLTSVKADTNGETEAGTTQRDLIRTGIVNIAVAINVNAATLKIITALSKQRILTVTYFDTDDLASKTKEMYMSDFTASLYKDTSKKGFWKVNFNLKEF